MRTTSIESIFRGAVVAGISLCLAPMTALGAINAEASVSFSPLDIQQFQFGSNTAGATVSGSRMFDLDTGFQSGTGSATVNGTSTSSFLKIDIEAYDSHFNPFSFEASNRGYAEAGWQDLIRVSGTAPPSIRVTVGVDVIMTFSDVNSVSGNRSEIGLELRGDADPSRDLTTFQSAFVFGNTLLTNSGRMASISYSSGSSGLSSNASPTLWSNLSITTLSPTSVSFHGERSATAFYNSDLAGYGVFVDFGVAIEAGGANVHADGSHSASILAITDTAGNDLRDRVTFASGMQFPSAAAAVPEPTSLSLWSLGALGLAAFSRRRRGPPKEA